ncbi:hypothetical protein MKZ38_009423 [Zalerion maritima]|uniref:Rhodopsin domain-containing protein n=1 Tax=Zalerion maritima TaxID=339359 RepID=A0AAD5RG00_9PEZI|nr:hypothetical protein MKZ38_009423 [Zalerion maritima]
MVATPIDDTGAYALLGVLLSLAWIFFGMRAYVRLWILRKVGADDALIFVAIISYTTFTGFACGLVAYGLGEEIDDSERLEDKIRYSEATKHWFFAELFFILTSTVLRVACGITLLGIITSKDRKVKWLIITVISVMASFSAAFFFISLFQCAPIEYFWENQLVGKHEGSCISNEFLDTPYNTMAAFYIVHSIISALTDWILGMLPYFIIRRVQMNKWKKSTVIALLGLGTLAGITAIIRVPLIIHATRHQFWDDAVPMAVTTALEPALGLIALSSATLMPLFKKGLRRINSRDGKYHEPESGGTSGGGSHRMTALGSHSRARPGNAHAANSETAIVVETSWIVEDEMDAHSQTRNTSEDEVMGTHKRTIGVEVN